VSDNDWLIAPNGRTRNGTIRSFKLTPKANRVWHWFPDTMPTPACGRDYTDSKLYNTTRDVSKATCKQCLYVAWLNGDVEEDDTRCTEMAAEHAKRLGTLGWRWPKGHGSNPMNPLTQDTIDLMRASRMARKVGRRDGTGRGSGRKAGEGRTTSD